ncbi:PaaI family thioesterase [Lichenibacterium dinghuense]|uniref:PaaI family thioesterase n=1 Tax=Lichenibacterium dinghuense TaxID=2895977 RepID=UPI001F1DC93C|nr:PaaI family thioesterase [Lichenibacterium sp. 6Y81]
MSDDAPDGFRALEVTEARAEGYNPIRFHARRIGAALALGFRVGPEHLNPGGRCHGGVLASFCDVQLAFAVLHDTPDLHTTILPTVNLALDYLAAVPRGAWVQGIGGTISVTRNLAVAQCIVTADGVPAVRCSGTFKVGGARVTGIDTGAWLRAQVDASAGG